MSVFTAGSVARAATLPASTRPRPVSLFIEPALGLLAGDGASVGLADASAIGLSLVTGPGAATGLAVANGLGSSQSRSPGIAAGGSTATATALGVGSVRAGALASGSSIAVSAATSISLFPAMGASAGNGQALASSVRQARSSGLAFGVSVALARVFVQWNKTQNQDQNTGLYGCQNGHLLTKNDAFWSGPCDICGLPAYFLDKVAHDDVYAGFHDTLEAAETTYRTKILGT